MAALVPVLPESPARARWRLALLWSAVALLPDVDAIGFLLGVPYEAPWGHRGATHSLLFALVIALALGPLHRRFSVARGWFFGGTLLVAVSHGLLDAATTGGLGVALAWPLSDERYFFPRALRVIPVAPIGLGMLTRRGLHVLVRETLLFSPLWLLAAFGAWRRRSPPRPSA